MVDKEAGLLFLQNMIYDPRIRKYRRVDPFRIPNQIIRIIIPPG